MDQLSKSLLTGFMGTNAMTVSSDLMSKILGENFREPAHLETLIKRLFPHWSGHAKRISAWGAHYAMGFIFAAIYVELWQTKKIEHSLKNGMLLGLVSGVLGYLIWKGTFKAHPLPPWINYSHYYLQRIPAHIVFAIVATLTYRLTELNNAPPCHTSDTVPDVISSK
ncbi:hypothetical protein [Mucilaginibacter myungsuensis]|uniref:Uncharacterized protein n=1 Tax=Mucilaginibacter myungsuensis TaxID=649104 RepID=A0A929KYW3_9SPHI|nr:hypothetical protein [Mucilaginibacter myungsuensis]MBE9663182.1 hypothetical protein [Mucilaginibacter myungsuensis]MDN3598817.1 hypothetical protein [Mucilaginibacter myungsuensis]